MQRLNWKIALKVFGLVIGLNVTLGVLEALLPENPVCAVLFWILDLPAIIPIGILAIVTNFFPGPGGDDDIGVLITILSIFGTISAFTWAIIFGRLYRNENHGA